MKKKNTASDDLARLVALGYSKTKATKALKDTGNNVKLAIELLKRQEDPQQQKQHLQRQQLHVPGGGSSSTPIPRPPLRPSAPPAARDTGDMEKQVRRHPCIVQYKKCQYGQYCALRDYPGDTCINYFHGTCLYGSSCRRRHVVDGIDIREERRPVVSDIFEDSEGKQYRLTDPSAPSPAVRVAISLDKPFSTQDQDDYMYAEACDFNLIRGSEPTHTDSIWAVAAQEDTDTAAAATAPMPFLDLVRGAATMGSSEDQPHAAPLRVTAPQNSLSNKALPPPSRRRQHPCIAQRGSCKYGDACRFAERDEDVCIFYLQGSCRYSADACEYRHETEAEFTDALREHMPQSIQQQQHQQQQQPRREKNRLQTFHSGTRSTSSAQWATSDDCSHTAPICHASEEISSSPSSPLAEDSAEVVMSCNPKDDKELRDFLWLMEVFPSQEPSALLHALRGCCGDPEAVAARLGEPKDDTAATDYALALAVAAAEEEDEEAERVQREGAARTDCLLVLCSLFPAVELDAVEAALDRSGNDFSSAYEVLFCMQAKIEKQAYGTVWRGNLSPLEMLRLEKLCAMFPKMDADVVRSTFGATDKNWSNAVAALNSLTDELLTLDENLSMGTVSTRLSKARSNKANQSRMPRACKSPSSPSSPPPEFGTVESAARMLKAADEELREYGDWRRVRDRAYLVNKCRLGVLAQAAAAYTKGDGALAKTLSREGRDLAVEYNRLNRLAMLALERERQENDPLTTLDLHFFHVEEALEVLTRRVEYCRRKNISRLRIVLGEGKHSGRGGPKVYPAVLQYLREDPYVSSRVNIVSVKPAFVEARVK